VPLFRRETLHERLAREGGLEEPPLEPMGPLRWAETGIHGVPRPREWEAVVGVDAPDVAGDELRFVVLADRTVLVDGERGDESLQPLAAAITDAATPPLRAEAVRRGEDRWVVAARAIRVEELGGVAGDHFVLAGRRGEREVDVDGARTFGSVPSLERLADAQPGQVVIEGERLAGDLWEVRVTPL
jgi:hypothetical protein